MPPERVDMRARRRAAELIELYLADALTGRDVAEAWPQSPADRALAAIGAEVLSEIHGDRFSDEFGEQAGEDIGGILGRCRQFLQSDLPYTWSYVGAPGCVTLMLGWVIALAALGSLFAALEEEYATAAAVAVVMTLAIGLHLRFSDKPDRLRAMVAGELRHWPFRGEEDRPADDSGDEAGTGDAPD